MKKVNFEHNKSDCIDTSLMCAIILQVLVLDLLFRKRSKNVRIIE